MSKEELIKRWKPILEFKSSMIEELPESEWEKYATMFEKAEEKHEDDTTLLKSLIPYLRRYGEYPEIKFNDYGYYFEFPTTSPISGKDIVVGVPLDKTIRESLPWYRIMLLGFIIPKYTFLISPTMEELYPENLKHMRSTHEFGVDV